MKIEVKLNDKIRCRICGQLHLLECGQDYITKLPVEDTLVYRCGLKKFIGAVNGLLVETIAKQKGRKVWRSK